LSTPRVFDYKHYELLNQSRGEVVRRLLDELGSTLGLTTALDIGCGVGYFSGYLASLGLKVTAVDGRQQNVEEARRRNPTISVHCYNAEDPEIRSLGTFDLVFCFGLLYHLENPLLAIRFLQAMTRKLLLVESVVFPGNEPIMALIDEEMHDDQGLNHVAFYPTEACLAKMLYRSGFSTVYRPIQDPQHAEYYTRRGSRRVRAVLAATQAPIASHQMTPVAETASQIRPWDPSGELRYAEPIHRSKVGDKFLREKVRSLKRIIKAR
jgi:SAM-dependent methyltransferase